MIIMIFPIPRDPNTVWEGTEPSYPEHFLREYLDPYRESKEIKSNKAHLFETSSWPGLPLSQGPDRLTNSICAGADWRGGEGEASEAGAKGRCVMLEIFPGLSVDYG